ncbi:MAG: TonB-dependent receptor plug domain-containing protein [Thiohalomonadales bacterium]
MQFIRSLTLSSITLVTSLFSSSAMANGAIEIDNLFSMSLEDLMDVEIFTAGKSTEVVKKVPASVLLINREDIEKYGYTTLTDILENTPGIYNIYSYAGVSGNFGLRGFWNANSQNSNIAILVNGVSQSYENDRTHPLEKINVPVEAIDRIEIIRGPMAVIYGNGASFGVINIITNEVNEDQPLKLASIAYGSVNTLKTAFRLSGQENQLKFVLNASHYRSDGLDNKFSDMMSAENAANLPNYGINDSNYSTKNLLSQNRKYFGLSGSYKHWVFDASYNESSTGIYLLVPPLEDGYQRDARDTRLLLGYQNALSRLVDVNMRVIYGSTYRADLAEFLVPNIENSEVINFNSLDLELLFTVTPSDATSIIFGINSQKMSGLRDVIDGPAVGIINESFEQSDRKTNAVFTQINYHASTKLSLVAGLRYEDLKPYKTRGITNGGLPNQSTFGNNIGDIQTTSPRLALVYSFNPHNILKLLYGEANRLGNDNLKPEITKTSEINYLFSDSHFNSSLSLFQNRFQDLVIRDLVFNDGTLESQQQNGGKIITNGIELIISSALNYDIRGEFGITAQDSDDRNNNSIEVAYSPTIVSHFKIAYQPKERTIALLARYVGTMESFYDLTRENIDGSFGARVGEKIDGYVVFDLNFRENNLYSEIYLNFKISNIFNEEIRYPNNLETNELLNRGTIGAGRSFVGTLGVEF